MSIRVAIADPGGTKKTQVKIPENVPVDRLLAALIPRLGHPQFDLDGQAIPYRLATTREGAEIEIDPDGTLADAGVQDDDVLRLYAEMRGGGDVPGSAPAMPPS